MIVLLSCALPVTAQPIEVASIRENRGPANDFSNMSRARFQPGRLYLNNYSIEGLVAHAYAISSALRNHLIVGWPDAAIKGTRFDITATLLDKGPPTDERAIIRELLTTRFGFKAHIEKRPLAVYRMKLANPGVLGPGLQRVTFDCAEMSPAEAPKDRDGKSLCRQGVDIAKSFRFAAHGSGRMETLRYQLQAIHRDRVIVDETGLQGYFAWDFVYGAGVPAFFTVIREQLGLQLEPAIAPVDVVVIDAVSMPTPN